MPADPSTFSDNISQHYLFDVAPMEVAPVFYALNHGGQLRDMEPEVKLGGMAFGTKTDGALDAHWVVALYADNPKQASAATLKLWRCSEQPHHSEAQALAHIHKLQVFTQHRDFDAAYQEMVWRQLARVMSHHRAPMVFVVLATPMTQRTQLDTRLFVPVTPNKLSPGYGLGRLQAAIAS